MKTSVLLTGATGFVGKVVLEELLRRRAELHVGSIVLIIRAKRAKSGRQRFDEEIASSACFSQLPSGWEKSCEVVEGELSEPGAGLSSSDRELIASSVTQIIHCAASVEFNLPLRDAARSNIASALNVLELAKACHALRAMVSMSTAYVTPHRFDGKPLREELVPLPFDAGTTYRSILAGEVEAESLLAQTGHPNTYTLTKCLAERLLMENRGTVPLTIVRPSIVSACWQHPFPGWIDSYAGIAGFAAIIGLGRMKAVIADPTVALDVVPCDEVAARTIACAFEPQSQSIRYAVAGVAHACRIDESCESILATFQDQPFGPIAALHHIGADGLRFRMHDALLHRAPVQAARAWFTLTGKTKQARRAAKLGERIDQLNQEFPYFTRRTFDFRPSMPLRLAGFSTRRYVRLICRGIARHLLEVDETRAPLAGASHKDGENDLRWALRKPEGNAVIRTLALAVRKGLRQGTDAVTFDRESFEDALSQAPAGTRFIVVPSHRSYLDFMLCSYLFFSHPSLGVRIPHIAAAQEFSKLAIVGWVLEEAHAFYLRRGQGREDVSLSRHVRSLVDRRETIQFFIEGARSRSGQFLPPRRGLLRCLQATGERFTVLPVAISYDRVPEESALLRELHGGPRPSMQLSKLAAWTGELARGKVSLGRVHLACGRPLTLDATTDIPALGQEIIGELQSGIAPTTRHLRAFLARACLPDIDVVWLTREIERRGGEVIETEDETPESVTPAAEQWMRWHYLHRFYGDARALWPRHPALAAHLARHDHLGLGGSGEVERLSDARTVRLVQGLFGSILRDYELVLRLAGTPGAEPLRHTSPIDVVQAVPGAHPPSITDAFEDLAQRQIFVKNENGTYAWGPRAQDIHPLRAELRIERPRPDSSLRSAVA